MKKDSSLRLFYLFLLFFLLQWGGQLAAAGASQAGKEVGLYLILLYSCFMLRGLIWIVILRAMTLSWAYTLSSLSYLIIPILSFLVFHESLWPRYLWAGLFILAGISLFGMGEQKKRRSREK
jgi:hypothetical protein